MSGDTSQEVFISLVEVFFSHLQSVNNRQFEGQNDVLKVCAFVLILRLQILDKLCNGDVELLNFGGEPETCKSNKTWVVFHRRRPEVKTLEVNDRSGFDGRRKAEYILDRDLKLRVINK